MSSLIGSGMGRCIDVYYMDKIEVECSPYFISEKTQMIDPMDIEPGNMYCMTGAMPYNDRQYIYAAGYLQCVSVNLEKNIFEFITSASGKKLTFQGMNRYPLALTDTRFEGHSAETIFVDEEVRIAAEQARTPYIAPAVPGPIGNRGTPGPVGPRFPNGVSYAEAEAILRGDIPTTREQRIEELRNRVGEELARLEMERRMGRGSTVVGPVHYNNDE